MSTDDLDFSSRIMVENTLLITNDHAVLGVVLI